MYFLRYCPYRYCIFFLNKHFKTDMYLAWNAYHFKPYLVENIISMFCFFNWFNVYCVPVSIMGPQSSIAQVYCVCLNVTCDIYVTDKVDLIWNRNSLPFHNTYIIPSVLVRSTSLIYFRLNYYVRVYLVRNKTELWLDMV